MVMLLYSNSNVRDMCSTCGCKSVNDDNSTGLTHVFEHCCEQLRTEHRDFINTLGGIAVHDTLMFLQKNPYEALPSAPLLKQ